MRGIECIFPNPKALFRFLEACRQEITNCFIYVLDQAAYYCGKRICLPEKIRHDEISLWVDRLLVFERLVLHIYPPNAQCSTIDTYNDFLKSECQFLVLIYDGVFLEIYTKNSNTATVLYNNAGLCGALEVTIKTDDTDLRRELFV